MSYFPISIKLTGKKVVVIGGGPVAERKIDRLLEAGATMTVISPTVTDTIHEWMLAKKLTWKQKLFEAKDVNGAFLMIASTDSRQVNRSVFEASQAHQLINIVDDPENSNFIVPSTFNRGKLTISVSTSGASPGLSKKMIEKVARDYGEWYEEYVDFLYDARKMIQAVVYRPELRRELFAQLLDETFLELSRQKQFEKREQHLNKLIMKMRELG